LREYECSYEKISGLFCGNVVKSITMFLRQGVCESIGRENDRKNDRRKQTERETDRERERQRENSIDQPKDRQADT